MFKSIIVTVIIFSVLAGILGLLIGIAAKFLYVKTDDRIEKVQALLPGANCGGCGYPGCSGLAEAIVNDGVSPKNCHSLKVENADEIKKIVDTK